jgi:hypothetical protein
MEDATSRMCGRHRGAAARWGWRPWRGRRELLRPHAMRHGVEDREKKRWRKKVDRWTPHVSGCGVLGRWEMACGLRWAERPNGLAV